MGRHWTGARCTNEVMKLELSKLVKDGVIKKDAVCKCVYSWERGESALLEAHHNKARKYILLTSATGDGKGVRQEKIYLTTKTSNLGIGEVLYFICPVSGERCRILYKAYNSPIFKSRQAYDKRLYYGLQQKSKRWLHNAKYWNLDERIKELEKMRFTDTYRGQKTKRALLLQRLKQQQAEQDRLRFVSLASSAFFKRITNNKFNI